MALNNPNKDVAAVEDDQAYAYEDGQLDYPHHSIEGAVVDMAQTALAQPPVHAAIMQQQQSTGVTVPSTYVPPEQKNLNRSYGTAINVTLQTDGRFKVTSGEDFSKLNQVFHCFTQGFSYTCAASALFPKKGSGQLDIRADEPDDLLYIPVPDHVVKDGRLVGNIDNSILYDGELFGEWVARKKAEGGKLRLDIKQTIYAVLDEDGTHPSDGLPITMTIPKESQKVYTRATDSFESKNAMARLRGKPEMATPPAPFEHRLKVSPGVRNESGDFPFTPWNFEVVPF
jgi:stringent starvation protein B